MRIVVSIILCLHLISPALAWAEQVKDPLAYSLKQYGLMLAISIFGGFVGWIAKVRRGELPGWNIMQLIGELATSAFAGLLAFWICGAFGVDPALTAPIAGISGYMGTRFIALLEHLGQKYVERKLNIEQEKKQ